MADHTLAERVLHLRRVWERVPAHGAMPQNTFAIAASCGFGGTYVVELLDVLIRAHLIMRSAGKITAHTVWNKTGRTDFDEQIARMLDTEPQNVLYLRSNPTAASKEPTMAKTDKPVKKSAAPKPSIEPTPCLCSCGAKVTRNYAQGHDAKHASKIGEQIYANPAKERALLGQLPTDHLRDRASSKAATLRNRAEKAKQREQEAVKVKADAKAAGKTAAKKPKEQPATDAMQNLKDSLGKPAEPEQRSGNLSLAGEGAASA